MYYEPIEDGDVRMVSLNYVKADDQSIYQIGTDSSGTDQGEGQQANALQIIRMALPAIKKGVKSEWASF